MVTRAFAKLVPAVIAALTALLLSLHAVAGSLSFSLSVAGPNLTLVNRGDASAFYPAVFRLLGDGSWGRLAPLGTPAELPPGASLQVAWPDSGSQDSIAGLERLRPVMVRFFDQAGVGFGQITFFRTPPAAENGLRIRYARGKLLVEAPEGASSTRASWVLWGQEEGIGPISQPVSFEHHPPPAVRIDWARQDKRPVELNTGRGQPAVVLLHETERGHTLQNVPGGTLQGREQRAAWLDASATFYAAALLFLAISMGAMTVQFLRLPRRRRAGS